ncbi:MAG: hypothetical protein ABEK02_06595 [Haloquadratum sp.]
MVDIDSETLFNGAAAVITTIAVLFFALNVDFAYSPVSKTALVVGFLAGIFALSQRTDDRQLTLFGYGVVVTSVVGLFFDLVNTFEVGNALTVLGLLAIAAVLFALRSQFDETNRLVSGRQATFLFGVLAVLAVVILAVDVATGALVYDLQPQSRIEIAESPHEQHRVASVVVSNPTPLPERVETPNYAVCTAGDWSEYRPPTEPGRERPPVRVDLNVQDSYNEYVMSFGSKTYPAMLYLDAANATGETFPVRRTSSCPDDRTGAAYIAIYEATNDRIGLRPV